MMKQIITILNMRVSFLSFLLFIIGASTSVDCVYADVLSDNRLYLENITLSPGETKEIPLLLANANEVKAVQGNIKLPDGIKFVTKTNGRLDVKNLNERSEDFTLSCALQEDGSMTFAHYSADGFAYEGHEGGIFTFKIEAEGTAVPGDYDVALTDVVMSINGVGYDMPDVSSQLVVKRIGGGDKEVTISTSKKTFDLLNALDVFLINKINLTAAISIGTTISEDVFFSSFKADVDESATTNTSDIVEFKTYSKGTTFIKENSPLGKVYCQMNEDGSFKAIHWRIEAAELDALTRDKDEDVSLSTYICFKAVDYLAPFDNIYVRLEASLKRSNNLVSKMYEKDENYWYSLDGMQYWQVNNPSALAAISFNSLYPQDDCSTILWRIYIQKYFDINRIRFTNSSGYYKVYFLPYEYELKAQDGTVYIVTPRRGAGDRYYNKFINRYDANHTHDYCLTSYGGGDEEANNRILNSCSINCCSTSTSPWGDGVFSNDTLYAIKKADYYSAKEYEPIAIIQRSVSYSYVDDIIMLLHEFVENKWLGQDAQPSGNKYALASAKAKENTYTEACLNAVGYAVKAERDSFGRMTGVFQGEGNKLNEQLRAFLGVVTEPGGIAHQLTDNIGHFASFQNTWLRPVNLLVDPGFIGKGETEGDHLLYALDMIKLFDWRGCSDGNMWGETSIPFYWTVQYWRSNQWLWPFYGVKEITIDTRASEVKICTEGSTLQRLNNTTYNIHLSSSGSGISKFPFDISWYNRFAENANLIAYMTNNKKSFGYVRIESGENVPQHYTLYIPFTIKYDWGELCDTFVVHVGINPTVDSIESLTPAPSPRGDGSIYSISGQRLSKPQRGVNIINGKKVVVK